MNNISFNFKNKTAVITGGAQGFGLDIAKRFLNSGAKVIIWDVDNKMIEKSLKDLNNPDLSSNIVDVSNFKEVEDCVNEITKSTKIDILINNAGGGPPVAAVDDLPDAVRLGREDRRAVHPVRQLPGDRERRIAQRLGYGTARRCSKIRGKLFAFCTNSEISSSC